MLAAIVLYRCKNYLDSGYFLFYILILYIISVIMAVMVTGEVGTMQRRKLPRIDDVICGSVVVMQRACGKIGCRCLKGYKHRSVYVSQYHKGAPRMVYIPKKNEKTVLRLVNNYRALKLAMHKASELNIESFTVSKK